MSSLSYCGYTCPAVDAETDHLVNNVCNMLEGLNLPLDAINAIEQSIRHSCEKMKEVGTYPLREALEMVCGELRDSKSSVTSLNERVEELEVEVEHLNQELSNCDC